MASASRTQRSQRTRRPKKAGHRLTGPEHRLAGSQSEIAAWFGRDRGAVRRANDSGALPYSIEPGGKKRLILVADAIAWVRSTCANADAVARHRAAQADQDHQHDDRAREVRDACRRLAARSRVRPMRAAP